MVILCLIFQDVKNIYRINDFPIEIQNAQGTSWVWKKYLHGKKLQLKWEYWVKHWMRASKILVKLICNLLQYIWIVWFQNRLMDKDTSESSFWPASNNRINLKNYVHAHDYFITRVINGLHHNVKIILIQSNKTVETEKKQFYLCFLQYQKSLSHIISNASKVTPSTCTGNEIN